MTYYNIKVGDKVRYTSHSEYDLTHGGVYQVVEVGDWWFGVTDDVGDYNTIDRNECEPVTDAPHMPYKQAYEKFTADAKQDTPDYNNGEWHGWNGGECPVHPESVVEWVHQARFGSSDQAKELEWRKGHSGIVAFRVTKPYVEPKKPREWWIVGGSEAWDNEQDAIENSLLVRGDIIHVREVLDD